MISWSHAKNNDVINVTIGKIKTHQHLIHDPLKFCKCVLQTKWQNLSLVQTILPMKFNSLKCCLNLVTLPQWQLMITRSQVEDIENLCLP
jgi:hypothetical protein